MALHGYRLELLPNPKSANATPGKKTTFTRARRSRIGIKINQQYASFLIRQKCGWRLAIDGLRVGTTRSAAAAAGNLTRWQQVRLKPS